MNGMLLHSSGDCIGGRWGWRCRYGRTLVAFFRAEIRKVLWSAPDQGLPKPVYLRGWGDARFRRNGLLTKNRAANGARRSRDRQFLAGLRYRCEYEKYLSRVRALLEHSGHAGKNERDDQEMDQQHAADGDQPPPVVRQRFHLLNTEQPGSSSIVGRHYSGLSTSIRNAASPNFCVLYSTKGIGLERVLTVPGLKNSS